MNRKSRGIRGGVCLVFWFVFFPVCAAPTIAQQAPAQTDAQKKDALTAAEKDEVLRSDGRNRIKAYFRVTERRLRTIRGLVGKENYKEASLQVGECGLIIDDAFDYIESTPGSKKKKDSLWKQMERGLQDQIGLMEALQRDFPFEFSDPIRQLVVRSKELRIRSLSSIFGPGILKNPYENNPPAKKKENHL